MWMAACSSAVCVSRVAYPRRATRAAVDARFVSRPETWCRCWTCVEGRLVCGGTEIREAVPRFGVGAGFAVWVGASAVSPRFGSGTEIWCRGQNPELTWDGRGLARGRFVQVRLTQAAVKFRPLKGHEAPRP